VDYLAGRKQWRDQFFEVLAAALFLLGFEAVIGLRCLLFRIVNLAIRLGTNLPQFAFVDPVLQDGFGGVLACFELRPLCLLWCYFRDPEGKGTRHQLFP
jgi:hypothetical protein